MWDVSASALLRLVDEQPRTPAERAPAVLAAVRPGADADAAPLGALHAELLSARAGACGDRLEAVATCGCGQELDLSLSTAALLGEADRAIAGAAGDSVTVRSGGYVVTARLPVHGDLAAVAAATADPAEARAALVARLVIRAQAGGRAVDAGALPADLVRRLADALDAGDPLAAPVLALTCPECGATTTAALDVAGFVHTELRRQADRVLHEVDALARRYGWTEDEVLALPPARRLRYLELS